jgi:hypothetical protein
LVNPGSNNKIYYFPVVLNNSESAFSVIALESSDGSLSGTGYVDSSGNSVHADVCNFLTDSGFTNPATVLDFNYMSQVSSLDGGSASSITFDSNTNDISFIPKTLKSYYTSGDGITDRSTVTQITDYPSIITTITDLDGDGGEVQIYDQFKIQQTVCQDGVELHFRLKFIRKELKLTMNLSWLNLIEKFCLDPADDVKQDDSWEEVSEGDAKQLNCAQGTDKKSLNPRLWIDSENWTNASWDYYDREGKSFNPVAGSEQNYPVGGTPPFAESHQVGVNTVKYKEGELHDAHPDEPNSQDRLDQSMKGDYDESSKFVKNGKRTKNCVESSEKKSADINLVITLSGIESTTEIKIDGDRIDTPAKNDREVQTAITKLGQTLKAGMKASISASKTPGKILNDIAKQIHGGLTQSPQTTLQDRINDVISEVAKLHNFTTCPCSKNKKKV